jgi:DNA repair protein RadC
MYSYADLPIKELLTLTVKEPVATELLTKFTTIRDLVQATPEALSQVKGLGQNRARQLLAAIEIGKRYALPTEMPKVI